LNIKNIDVEQLAGERLGLRQYLEQNVWPLLPETELGRVLSREEEAQILGFGPEGY
jgi:hypothetical protein